MCTCICTWVAGRITRRDRYHLVLRIGYRSLSTGRTGGHRTTKAHIRSRPVADHGGGVLIFLRTRMFRSTGHKPIEASRAHAPSRIVPGRGAFFAFHSMGVEYLTLMFRSATGWRYRAKPFPRSAIGTGEPVYKGTVYKGWVSNKG